MLSSYLSRIGRIENPSCSACGHSSQDVFHLILHGLATDSLRCSLFRYVLPEEKKSTHHRLVLADKCLAGRKQEPN